MQVVQLGRQGLLAGVLRGQLGGRGVGAGAERVADLRQRVGPRRR